MCSIHIFCVHANRFGGWVSKLLPSADGDTFINDKRPRMPCVTGIFPIDRAAAQIAHIPPCFHTGAKLTAVVSVLIPWVRCHLHISKHIRLADSVQFSSTLSESQPSRMYQSRLRPGGREERRYLKAGKKNQKPTLIQGNRVRACRRCHTALCILTGRLTVDNRLVRSSCGIDRREYERPAASSDASASPHEKERPGIGTPLIDSF